MEVLPINEFIIYHINHFDDNMKVHRSRKPDKPPPLIDVSNGYLMDENYVIEQISVDANPLLPQLPDDNDYEDVIG